MLNRKELIDVLIVVMTIAAVALGLCAARQAGYQDGFTAAKALVENSNLGALIRTPDDIRSLAGTVTAVNGERLTLHLVSNSPFDDPALADRTVLVASSTKITKFVLKDPKVFQSELAAYTKTKSAPPPVPLTVATITLSDIKIGDSVLVTASGNIKSRKEFTAVSIQDQPRPGL